MERAICLGFVAVMLPATAASSFAHGEITSPTSGPGARVGAVLVVGLAVAFRRLRHKA